MRKFIIFFSLLVLAATSAFAQVGESFIEFSPNFFIAILAGIILAFGFQAVLTILSVAVGINVVGPFNKAKNDNKKSKKHDSEDHDSDNTPTSVKISSAAGVWALVTVSISLFFASWFGVKLSLFQNNTIGMTLGLVIWAAFFLVMMYLEVRSISSVAGGFFNLIANTLKTSAGAVKSIFSKSEESKMVDLVDHSIEKIRAEIGARLDTDFITEKLDEYVSQLKPEPIDYNRLEQELKHILNEVEIEHRLEPGEGRIDRRTIIRIAEENPSFTKEDVKKVGDLYDRIRTAVSQGETRTEKLAAVFDAVTPGSEADSANIRNKIAEYLRKTNAEEIKPEKLEQDLEEILNHPKSAKEIIMNRVNQLDRNTLIQLIRSSNEKIDDDKAERIIKTAENVMQKIKSSITGASDTFKTTSGENRAKFGEYSHDVKQGMNKKRLEWEMKLREFFESFKRPEYDYDRFKSDIIRMFKNPSQAPGIISMKLKDYDRDTLIEILSRNKYLEKKDIENFISKFDEARDTLIHKYEEVENQVRLRVQETKQATLNQMENARKTAAVASWWLIGTAVVSGIASLLGGMLAI